MPHVIVKMLVGRSEAQKAAIAEAVTKAVMETARCAENSVSVAIEDIAPEEWDAKVLDPDIRGRKASLYKKPGYAEV